MELSITIDPLNEENNNNINNNNNDINRNNDINTSFNHNIYPTSSFNSSNSSLYPSSHFNTVFNFPIDEINNSNSNNNSSIGGSSSSNDNSNNISLEQQQQQPGRLSHISNQINQFSSRTNSFVNQIIHNATHRINNNNDDGNLNNNDNNNNNSENNNTNTNNNNLNTLLNNINNNSNRLSNLISNDFITRLQNQQLHQQLQQQLQQQQDIDDQQQQQQQQQDDQQQQQQDNNSFNTNASTRIDIPMVLKWLEQNIMFLSLLLVIFIYVHKQGIVVFIWQQVIFSQSNQTLRRQVSLQKKRNIGILLWLVLILSSNILTTYLFFSGYQLWKCLIFMPPAIEFSIWNTLWVATVNDFLCRFITMIVKSLCVAAVGHLPPYKRRAQLYAAIESVSYLYRMLTPTVVWVCYIQGLAIEGEYMFSVTIMGLYLSFKLAAFYNRTRVTISVVRAFLLHHTMYGKKASPEQVAEMGDHCSICQEKMESPIQLRCNHIFCEDCVSQWFEREKTCPLCRSPIHAAGHRTHSDGSTSLLLQLF